VRGALWLALLALLAPSAWPASRETGFLNRGARVAGQSYRYQVYVPHEWTKGRAWPVILFLHGAGERGQDGLFQTEVGLGRAIRRAPERFPALVVFPQCRKDVWWSDPAMEAQVLAALDAALREFKGDPDRVYLSGISMGGYATWSLAARHPGRFAALVPICGGVRRPWEPEPAEDPYAPVARAVARIPTWVFHGAADDTVPVTESRRMVEALKAAGASPRYTEYEGVGHESWDPAYDETELWPWLFAQRAAAR
jgi:predicted peptidase